MNGKMNGTMKDAAFGAGSAFSKKSANASDACSAQSCQKAAITVDGQEIEAIAPASILQAAGRAGIRIPTLCHHPALEPYGACRLCTVQIEKGGIKKFVTACNYPVEEGLAVFSSSPEVLAIRRTIIELLLGACPNEKRLLDLAIEYDVLEVRFAVEGGDCILCGLCHRVCEEVVGVSAINAQKRGVFREVDTPYGELSEDCIGCGSCELVCPTGSISRRKNIYPLTASEIREIESRWLEGQADDILGIHSRIFAGRSAVPGQDGGMVSAILCQALESGRIDAAVVARRDRISGAVATVAADAASVLMARGTKYVRISVLPALLQALSEGKGKGDMRIAVVGTPCQIRSLRKLQNTGYFDEKYPGTEIIAVGLFCFESFDYSRLREHAARLWGIDIDCADKMQISKGRAQVNADGKDYSCRASDLGWAVREGCPFCDDLVSRLADISIGSIGSADGYSTVIVRSRQGESMIEGVLFEPGKANREEVAKIASVKKRNAGRNFARIIETSILDQYSS